MILNPLGTPVKMVNAALSLLGEKPITAFTDGSAAGLVMESGYEMRVRSCLVSTRWRFNTKQAALVKLAGAPLELFTARYQIPADAIAVHSVSYPGTDKPIELAFDVFEDEIYASPPAGVSVICDYAVRKNEDRFPAGFAAYVVESVASDLAAGVLRDADLAILWAQSAERKRRIAASMEAQSRTVQKLDLGAFDRIRRR